VGGWVRENLVDLALAGTLIVGIFVGTFGVANWSDHVPPSAPSPSSYTAEQYERLKSTYQDRLDQTGKNAVVPWVWAVPLTFAGAALAVAAFATLVARNQ
jgi:hypothetical protein